LSLLYCAEEVINLCGELNINRPYIDGIHKKVKHKFLASILKNYQLKDSKKFCKIMTEFKNPIGHKTPFLKNLSFGQLSNQYKQTTMYSPSKFSSALNYKK
jgi:hypothetical protein